APTHDNGVVNGCEHSNVLRVSTCDPLEHSLSIRLNNPFSPQTTRKIRDPLRQNSCPSKTANPRSFFESVCQRKIESSASPQDRKFRFLKPGWGSARGKGWRRPLLRTSSPLKPKNQPRTHIAIGTARGHFNHIGVRCMGMLKDLP